jgi:hypothetical protein
MCEPTTATLALTSLGLTAAGTAAQYAGAKKSKKAMDAVAAAEKLRQDKYKEESKVLFDQSLGQSGADVSNENIARHPGPRSDLPVVRPQGLSVMKPLPGLRQEKT